MSKFMQQKPPTLFGWFNSVRWFNDFCVQFICRWNWRARRARIRRSRPSRAYWTTGPSSKASEMNYVVLCGWCFATNNQIISKLQHTLLLYSDIFGSTLHGMQRNSQKKKNRKQSNQTNAYSFLCEIILKHGSNSRFTSLAGHRRNWHRWSSRLSRWARRGRPRWISRTKRRVRPTGTVPEWLLLCPNAFSATTSNAAAAATEQGSISAQSQLQGLICIQFLWIVLGWKTFTFLLY